MLKSSSLCVVCGFMCYLRAWCLSVNNFMSFIKSLVGPKTSYHRHKGVSVGWVTSFWLSKLLCFGWVKWDSVKTGRCDQRWVGTPGRRCRCSGRRRRFAPPPASAAATAARRAHPPSLTAPSSHTISFYSAKIKQFTQPKRIYSANGNPFMPMIWRFCAHGFLFFSTDINYLF